ncbi:MAG: hypothetical protein HOM21_07350 [Halobacteriovoraceae bacterium]|nr:hypothetical protein [Halobacteriovoraceae bacterium]
MDSVNIEAIDDFLNKSGEYSREIYQLRPKKFYIKPDVLDSKIHEYLRPHSLYYYSSVNSFFLFEIKSLDMLNLYFDFFLARDGLVSTLKFFYLNPTPGKTEARILINNKFANIVPIDWSSKVAFYSPCLTNSREEQVKTPKAIYLTALIDEAQFDLEFLTRKLEEMKDFYGSSWDSIPKYCLSFKTMYMGEEDIEAEPSLNFEFLKALFSATDSKIEFLNWSGIRDHTLEGTVFYDFNQQDLLYSDSFVQYHFLSSGAAPFNSSQFKNSNEDQGRFIQLSQYHGHLITNQYPEYYQKNCAELSGEIANLSQFVLKNEENLERSEKTEYDEARLCTPEFVTFSKYVAQKYCQKPQ